MAALDALQESPAARDKAENNIMGKRDAWGLIAAATLGAAAGLMAAPQPARRELHRRASHNLTALARASSEQGRVALDALSEAASSAGRTLSILTELIAGPLSAKRRPTAKLKDSFANDPILRQRHIWVDAYGDTILLH